MRDLFAVASRRPSQSSGNGLALILATIVSVSLLGVADNPSWTNISGFAVMFTIATVFVLRRRR